MNMRDQDDMRLWLSRKQIRLSLYFIVFLTFYCVYRLLFGQKTTFVDPTLPELIVQRGNDHYLKGNADSSKISGRKEYGWRTVKTVQEGINEKLGKLNVHIWSEICGEELKSLRNHVLFPQFPSRRLYTKTTLFPHSQGNRDFGERIFGFIRPKKDGLHRFRVQGLSVEVWVSTDANPNHSKLFVKMSSENNDDTQHEYFNLEMFAAKQYYIEILHKKGGHSDSFQLRWKGPGSNVFVELSGKDISLMLQDKHLGRGQIDSDNPIEEILPIHNKDPFPVSNDIEQARTDLYKLPFMKDVFLENVLPECEYKPSYLVHHPVKNYKGVWETHYNSLFPIDKTNITRDGWVCLGNDVLAEKKAVRVVQLFMDALNKVKHR